MLDPKHLIIVGGALATVAALAFISTILMTPDGGPIFLAYGLGFGMVLLMFVVNAASRDARIRKERGWVVFALGLMAAIMVIATVNRLLGVDGDAFTSVLPYMVIVGVAVVAGVVAVRRRQRGL